MEKLLEPVPQLGKIRLHYDVCPRTKNRLDVMNVGSIVDKYFSDCLTEYGIIEDDDYTHIDFASFGFGGLATEEHVLVTITEIEPRKEEIMRILLDEDEIQSALEAFVETLGFTGMTGVDLGTDDDGNVTAEVLMGEAQKTTKRAPAKNKGGRPKGSTNKKKEPEPDVATTGDDSPAGDDSGTPEPDSKESAGTSTEDGAKKEEPAKEGGKGKNLFEENPETSSSATEGDSTKAETSGDTEVKPAKKSSIFDQ